jgi:hypothetical protein
MKLKKGKEKKHSEISNACQPPVMYKKFFCAQEMPPHLNIKFFDRCRDDFRSKVIRCRVTPSVSIM